MLPNYFMYCFSLSVSIDNLNIDVNFSLFVSPRFENEVQASKIIYYSSLQ